MPLTLVRTSPVLGNAPAGLTFDGKYLYMADAGGKRIHVYDKDFNRVRVSGALVVSPYGLAFDGKYLYVVPYGAVVYKYDKNFNLIRTITAFGSQVGITFDGKHFYTFDVSGGPAGRYIKQWDQNFVLIRTQPGTGRTSSDMATDGKYLYNVSQTTNTIYKYDKKFNLIKSAALGYAPWGLTFDGKYLYIGDNAVQLIKKYTWT